MLLVMDYRGRDDLNGELLLKWSLLDPFDRLSPTYDQRQTRDTCRRWFQAAPLRDVDVHYGYNGMEGRGVKT